MSKQALTACLLFALFVTIVLFVPAGQAETLGSLRLTVVAEDGTRIAGAQVTLTGESGAIGSRVDHTDIRGNVRFSGLPAGDYRVDVARRGFVSVARSGLTVGAGLSAVVELVLSPSATVPDTKNRPLDSPRVKAKFDQEGYVAEHEVTSQKLLVARAPLASTPPPPPYRQEFHNTESYDSIAESGFRPVSSVPLSTFSIDVDTASYSNVRRFLNMNQWPPTGAVRIEELINYFDYQYPRPTGAAPFGLEVEVGAAPWNPQHRLARIGIKGRELDARERPASNLVFLLDVSGSMSDPNKLPLVQRSMRMLVNELNARDRVSIVVYAGAAGLVLAPTSAANKSSILAAIDSLQACGSTAGGAGIELAYRQARESFIAGGVNRVVLATDGDFNVGITDQSRLVKLIESNAKSGVFLTALGFGMGNYKDSTLEKLADHGNGNYAYIDSMVEARKVLVEEYRRPAEVIDPGSGELLTVKVRWKAPDGERSKLQELAVIDEARTLATVSDDFRFAAAVATFGMLLRESEHVDAMSFDQVLALAEGGLRSDPHGHRAAFLDLVGQARELRRDKR